MLYLGIPEYIWHGIFSLLNVLGAGLILAVFATKYQKRKEIELQIKADVLKLQLGCYVEINTLFLKLQSNIAPPLVQEAYFSSIINTEAFGIKYMEYSSIFVSEQAFDNYYKEVSKLLMKDHLYLQYSVEIKLKEFISYLSELKLFLDAFCDTEHTELFKYTEKQIAEHIKKAYQLVGICVQNDLIRFYAQMDQLLAYQISHITLAYKIYYTKSIKDKLLEAIVPKLENFIDQQSIWGRICNYAYYRFIFSNYNNTSLIAKMPTIVVHLAYLHYSDEYTPEEWYSLPNKDVENKIHEFVKIFMLNTHHG